MTKSANRLIKFELDAFKYNFIWICSGTPYFNRKSFIDICNFITQIDLNSFNIFDKNMYHIHSDVIKKIFRKNTKEQIKDQIHIPDPIIETKLLKQNEIENAIYNSVRDEKKMIQIMSHVSIR